MDKAVSVISAGCYAVLCPLEQKLIKSGPATVVIRQCQQICYDQSQLLLGIITMSENSWLAGGRQMTIAHDQADLMKSEGLSLSELLAHTREAINHQLPSPVWVRAEINSVKIKTTRYRQTFYAIELAEIANGRNKAQAQAKIWPRHLSIVTKFEQNAQTRLAEQIQVLALVTVDLHSIYGLQLEIIDLDPNFTLGMMAAKKRAIRRVLQHEGLLWRNKELEPAMDFTHVMVISPNNAAGLGDFQASAELLQQLGLCRFDYLQATFQSQQAPNSIHKALQQAVSRSPLPDAVVLIRGGGAAGDLNWLNDESLARTVCRYPVPVYTGIGHEQDSTILDEIAHQQFSTPSKVIEYIRHRIQTNALAADNNAQAIQHRGQHWLSQTNSLVSAYKNQIDSHIVHRLAGYERDCRHHRHIIESNSYHLLQYRQQTITHLRHWMRQQIIALTQSNQASSQANYHTIAQISIHHLQLANHSVQYHHVTIKHNAQTLLQQHWQKQYDRYRFITNQGYQLLQHVQYRMQSNRQYIINGGQAIVTARKAEARHHHYKMHNLARYEIQHLDHRINHLLTFINSCSPQNVLQQGYTLVQQHGKYITASQQLNLDEELTIHFHDGTVNTKPVTKHRSSHD